LSIMKKNIIRMIRNNGVMFGLLTIIIIVSFLEPAFFSIHNFLNILRQSSAVGLCALGMTFIMIGGGFDLSIGSTLSLSSVTAILIMNSLGVSGFPVIAAIIAIISAIIVGGIAGFINGGIIATINGRMGEAFIITYSMQIVIGALALLITGGQFTFGRFPPESLYSKIGTGLIPIFIFFGFAILMQFILTRTNFGRQTFFLGASMDVAKMSGIKIKKIRVVNHIIGGMFAGLAGVIVTSRVYSASPLQGVGYELEAIAAVVIGGTSLSGGSGSIIKTVLGVLVVGILANALNVIGVNSNVQLLAKGGIIIIAVGLDIFNRSIGVKVSVK